jgi:hypothetical protein
MDPNENLSEQRRLRQALLDTAPGMKINLSKSPLAREYARRLAELSEELDNWLSKGGFLPVQWASVRDHKKVVVR